MQSFYSTYQCKSVLNLRESAKMKNRLKHQRNEELRTLYFALLDPNREGGPMRRKDALEKVLEIAGLKYCITSTSTLEYIIFEYGFYAPEKKFENFSENI